MAAPVHLTCQGESGAEPVPVVFDEATQAVRIRGKVARKVDITRSEIEFQAEDRGGRPFSIRVNRKNGQMLAKQVGGNATLKYQCSRD